MSCGTDGADIWQSSLRQRKKLPHIPADRAISGLRFARELDRIIEAWQGKMIVSDNRSEFTSNAILQWTAGLN